MSCCSFCACEDVAFEGNLIGRASVGSRFTDRRFRSLLCAINGSPSRLVSNKRMGMIDDVMIGVCAIVESSGFFLLH